MIDIFLPYSNNLVFYSCLGDDKLLFKNISLLNIIIEDKITSKDPINVLVVGISFQIKYPNIIANTKAKYFNGVTKLTSENLYDWDNHKLAKPPRIPTRDNKHRSIKLGNIQFW